MVETIFLIRANSEGFLVAHILPEDAQEPLRIPDSPSLHGECYGTGSELESIVRQRYLGARRRESNVFQHEITTRGGNPLYTQNI